MQRFLCCRIPPCHTYAHGVNDGRAPAGVKRATSPPGLGSMRVSSHTSRLPASLTSRKKIDNEIQQWHISPLERPEELEQLVVDDDSDTESGRQDRNKGRQGLGVVKNRLIRHISHDKGMRSKSLTSPAVTDQDVAWRAELRRLRHERIQNELDDANSDDGASNMSHNSTSYLGRIIEIGQPKVRRNLERQGAAGPGDSHKPIVLPSNSRPCHVVNEPAMMGSIDEVVETPIALSQTQCCHCPKREHQKQEGDAGREASPVTVPALVKPSPGSAAEHWGKRSLSLSRGSQHDDVHSGLGIWLLAQGLHSTDIGGETPDTAIKAKHKASPQPCCTSLEPAKGPSMVDADLGTPTKCERNAPFESWKRWASQDKLSFHSTRSSLDLAQQRGELEKVSKKLRAQPSMTATTVRRPSGQRIRTNTPEVAIDNASSHYSTDSENAPAVRDDPIGGLHHLSARDVADLQLSPFQWQESRFLLQPLYPSEGQSSYATAADIGCESSGDKVKAAHRLGVRKSDADISMTDSDAASFRHREAELDTIQDRFGEVLSRRRPAVPMSSRFREEFSEPGPSRMGRHSLMAKLNLAVPRLSRSEVFGRSSKERSEDAKPRRVNASPKGDSNIVLWPPPTTPNLPAMNPSTPLPIVRSATDVWKTAIEAEQREYEAQKQRKGLIGTIKSLNKHKSHYSGSRNVETPDNKGAGLQYSSTGHPTRDLLQRWVASLDGAMRAADAEQASAAQTSGDRPVHPRGWADFPLHRRHSRSCVNGKHDIVHGAITSSGDCLAPGEELETGLCSKPVGHRQSAVSFPRTKLGRVVKSSLSRLLLRGEASSESIGPRHHKSEQTIAPLDGSLDTMKWITHKQQVPSYPSEHNLHGLSATSSDLSQQNRTWESIAVPKDPNSAYTMQSERSSTPATMHPLYNRDSLGRSEIFRTPLSHLSMDALQCKDEMVPTLSLGRVRGLGAGRSRSAEIRKSTPDVSPWAGRSATQPLRSTWRDEMDEDLGKLFLGSTEGQS